VEAAPDVEVAREPASQAGAQAAREWRFSCIQAVMAKVFKTDAAWRAYARSVRLRRRSVKRKATEPRSRLRGTR